MQTGLQKTRNYLAEGTTDALMLALTSGQTDYCLKMLSLDRLLAVWKDQEEVLDLTHRLADVRDEVLRRLLVSADRRTHRPGFVQLCDQKRFDCPHLAEFVHKHYQPRPDDPGDAARFATAERKYRTALRAVVQRGTELKDAVNQALTWLDPGPRILFSNADAHRQMPVVLPGVCIKFMHHQGKGETTFMGYQEAQLTREFVKSADEAESLAYDMENRNRLKGRSQQIKIEDALVDMSYLDGGSGYLAFLMARLWELRGVKSSAYLGFTGTKREGDRLGRVKGLANKLDAAVNAGMRVVFVPLADLAALSAPDRERWGKVLHLLPFDERDPIRNVAAFVLNYRQTKWIEPDDPVASPNVASPVKPNPPQLPVQKEAKEVPAKKATPPVRPPANDLGPVAPPVPPPAAEPVAPNPAVPQVVRDAGRRPVSPPPPASPPPTVSPPPPASDPPLAPELLFPGRFRAFRESGGTTRVPVAATRSVFAAPLDGFLTIYPDGQRLYFFDSTGLLQEDRRLHVVSGDAARPSNPISVTWSDDLGEFVVGFNTGRIERFAPDVSGGRGVFRAPPGFVPLHLAASGPVVLAAHGARVGAFAPSVAPRFATLPGPVGHLEYAPSIDRVLACVPNRVIALTRDLRTDWEWTHPAPAAVATAAPNGDLWVALSNGLLLRLDAATRRPLLQVPGPVGACGVVVAGVAVVVGSASGVLDAYGTDGTLHGRDDLGVCLNHLTGGSGDSVIASTARGPTVLRPPWSGPPRDRRPLEEESLRTLDGWLARPLTAADVAAIDLNDWPRVIALQTAYLRRREADPGKCVQFERRLEFFDRRKAACVCTRTRPAFIDGSNVSRYFFDDEKAAGNPHPKGRSRLINAMRDKLAAMANPSVYPIITTVDVTERGLSDDAPGLARLIAEGVIEETPSRREADALILTWIRDHNWADRVIVVSRDRKMHNAHAEILRGVPPGWYEGVRWEFHINPRTLGITLLEPRR